MKNLILYTIFLLICVMYFVSCRDEIKYEGNNAIEDATDSVPYIVFDMPEFSSNLPTTYATPTVHDMTINDVSVIGVAHIRDSVVYVIDTIWYSPTDYYINTHTYTYPIFIYTGCEVVSDQPHFITQLTDAGKQRQKLKVFNFIPNEGDYVYVMCNVGITDTLALLSKLGNPHYGHQINVHDLLKIDYTTLRNDGTDVMSFSGMGRWQTKIAAIIDMRFSFAKVCVNIAPGLFTGKTVTFQVYNDSKSSCFFPDNWLAACPNEGTDKLDYIYKDSYNGGSRCNVGDTVLCLETPNRSSLELQQMADYYYYYYDYNGNHRKQVMRDQINFDSNSPYLELKVDDGISPIYYRLDFFDVLTSSFLDVRRSTIYTFNITTVENEGYPTREETLKNPGNNIKYSIYSNRYDLDPNLNNYGSYSYSYYFNNEDFRFSGFTQSGATFENSMALTTNNQYAIGLEADAMLVYGNEGTYSLGNVGLVDPDTAARYVVTNNITATAGITVWPTQLPIDTVLPMSVTFASGITDGVISFRFGNIKKDVNVKRKSILSGEEQVFYVGKAKYARRLHDDGTSNIKGFASSSSITTATKTSFAETTPTDCYTFLRANETGEIKISEARFYDLQESNLEASVLKVVFCQSPVTIAHSDITGKIIVCPWYGNYTLPFNSGVWCHLTPDYGSINFTTSMPPFTATETLTVNYDSSDDVSIVGQTGWLNTASIPAGSKNGSVTFSYKTGESVVDGSGKPILSTITFKFSDRNITIEIYPKLP